MSEIGRSHADLRLRRLDGGRRTACHVRRTPLLWPVRTACPESDGSAWLGSGPARGRVRSSAAHHRWSGRTGRRGTGGSPARAPPGWALSSTAGTTQPARPTRTF